MEARPLSELLGDLDTYANVAKEHAEWKNRVGSSLRAARETLNLSRPELERISGVPQAYIWQIENGQRTPSATTAESLSQALFTATQEASLGDKAKARSTAKADAAKARKRRS